MFKPTTAVIDSELRQHVQPLMTLAVTSIMMAVLSACGGQETVGTDNSATLAQAPANLMSSQTNNESQPVALQSLQVELPMLDSAVIRSTPEGINCGKSVASPVCSFSFAEGSTVRLAQTYEDSKFKFSSWGGDCQGIDCLLTMNSVKSVRAQYETVVVMVPEKSAPPAYIPVCDAYKGPQPASLVHTEGLMHEHSSYSDGDPAAIPYTYYEIAKKAGYGYVGASEHSDTYDALNFITVHDTCTFGLTDPQALAGKVSPDYFKTTANSAQLCFASPTSDKLLKWESTLSQAVKSSTKNFLAIRGFEWTSDVFGHINVFFSKNFSNAKTDGGYALSMEGFWDWFSRSPELPGIGGSPTSTVPMGGGSDGLGTFNHPGDKCQLNSVKAEPTGTAASLCNWNSFATSSTLQPLADGIKNPSGLQLNANFEDIKRRMFGMEMYNDANRGDRYAPFFHEALDKGWFLSPVGSEDEHFGQYATEIRPKTVTITTGFSEAEFREAWLARRTYALSSGVHLRVTQLIDNTHQMGSRLQCDSTKKTTPLTIQAFKKDSKFGTGPHYVKDATYNTADVYTYKLFTKNGNNLRTIKGESATFDLPIEKGQQRWYYVQVWDADNKGSLIHVAPVWVTGK